MRVMRKPSRGKRPQNRDCPRESPSRGCPCFCSVFFERVSGLRRTFLTATLLAAASVLSSSCGVKPDPGLDDQITKRGSIELSAELMEIRGEFIDRLDYDYAFVMKYKVHQVYRGKVDSDVLYVAHYNPQKPRGAVADARVTDIGGNLKKFKAGEVHRMALEVPIDDYYMGGIVNRYFDDYQGPVHWALWTNRVIESGGQPAPAGGHPVKRYGMVIKVRPEKLDEYKKLHAAVWPEVLKMITACNIRNYSIYFKDGYLFSYFEYTGQDFDADMAKMAADPTTQKWWDVCKPCQEPLETRAPGEWWANMEEVFHYE